MSLPSLIVYVLSLGVVVAVCWQAQKLAKSFRLYFLSFYLGYLVVVSIVFILNLVATGLSADVLKSIPLQGRDPVYILFGLVVFPLFALAYYYALAFVTGILDEEFSFILRAGYILLWVVLIAVFLTRIQFVLKQRRLPPLARILNTGSGLIVSVIPIAVFVYLMFRAARRSRSDERAGLVKFGAISLIGYFLLISGLISTQIGLPFSWGVPVLLGLAMLSPVLALKRFLVRFYRPIPPGTFEGPKMSSLCGHYKLSNREGEILNMLLKGKSNKEIEKDLFISPHTVRNHIYNIYQKLGIGNRLQLMSLVRSWIDGGKVTSI
jgi:DNA-binding CsgD family transcriptional regulator